MKLQAAVNRFIEAVPVEGTRITRAELAARWAFSEFCSKRWNSYYNSILPEKPRNELTSSDFKPDDIAQLANSFAKHRSHLVKSLDIADYYECQSWTKEQLGRTNTLLCMSPNNRGIPFLSYLACPRVHGAGGQIDLDPRDLADTIPFEIPFIQTEPVIVVMQYGFEILLEGYLRSILFMRRPELDTRILVWYPVLD